MTRGNPSTLLEGDPEIERRLHQRGKEPAQAHNTPVEIEVEISENMAEQEGQRRTLSDYARPSVLGSQSSIVRPPVTAQNFELKPGFIQMIQQSAQFHGLADEDPNNHLENFLEVCDMLKINGVSDDAIRLRAFPFSLKAKAKLWLQSLPRASITTWDQMVEVFLARYFPPGKSAKLRNEISSFVQLDSESLFETWERFKDLLRKCPQHGFPDWMIVHTFYNGLNPSTKQMLDAASGGTLGNKTPDEARQLIEEMSMNSYQWNSREKKKMAGLHEVDAVTSLAAQVEALTRKLDSVTSPRVAAITSCDGCGGSHVPSDCPFSFTSTSAPVEQVDFVGNSGRGQGNPYGNTYNQGWRNHPNFSWSNQGQQKPTPPPGFQQQPPQPSIPERVSDLEKILSKFIQSSDTRFQNIEATLRNQTASLHNLENQVGQIAKSLAERPHGSLPSNTETNPREQLKAITLRSGRELTENTTKQSSETLPQKSSAEIVTEIPKEKFGDELHNKEKGTVASPPPYEPRIPYPARLRKDKDDEQNRKFLDLFKQLHINIPFVEALSQMPKYAKFLKDLLTNKRKMEESVAVILDGNCSALLQKNLPNKMKDPGSFIIQCAIGGLGDEKALADSGASINVMPYSLFQKLGLGEPRPTRMTLQLADRSIRHPRGIIEDVLVKVDKFIFPADFVVLDVDEDAEVPLILGRPFLRTSRALIDMDGGEMTLRIGEEKITFRLAEAMKHSLDFDDSCYFLDVTDEIAGEFVQEILTPEPYSAWPDLEETILIEDEAPPLKSQPNEGVLKTIFRRLKKSRRRRQKCSIAPADMRTQGDSGTHSRGIKFDQFPLSMKQFCLSCMQDTKNEFFHRHEPP